LLTEQLEGTMNRVGSTFNFELAILDDRKTLSVKEI